MLSRIATLASRRYLWRRRLQLTLAILGIAMGVAVVVAVDLANNSARRGFELSMDALTGAATHQVVGGPSGLDEDVYTRLRTRVGVRNSAPVIEAWGSAGGSAGGGALQLLGIDPFAERGFRSAADTVSGAPLGRLLVEPGSVLMSKSSAARLGVAHNGHFTVEFAGVDRELTLVGWLDDAAPLDDVLIADIATAQELSGHLGKLSWIDLRIPESNAGRKLLRAIRQALPPDAALLPAESRSGSMAEMTRGFHTNLTAMSLLALVVGMFLIYNTMSFTVLQRRALFGRLRVAGVTPGEIFRIILFEALALGLVGTVLGLLLGVLLGQGLVQLVTRTINDLYFALSVTNLRLDIFSLLKGLALGIGATLGAALLPALDAASTQAQLTLRRSVIERRAHSLAPKLAIVGLVLTLAALAALALPGHSLVVAFGALFALMLGLTLATPWAVAMLVRLIIPAAGRLFGVQARLAVLGVDAALSRTGVAVAALMLAIATTVGVGVMIDSFRSAVSLWLESTLRADIYVRTPSMRSARTQAHLDPALIQRIRALPGIHDASTARFVDVETPQGHVEVFALDTAAEHPPNFLLKDGDADTAWPQLLNGETVFVSEPYAWRHQIDVGDTIDIRTDHGEQSFPVAAVYHDYDAGPGVVMMHRSLYKQHFNDRAIDGLGLYLAPGIEPAAVIAAIHDEVGANERVIVRSNRELRAVSLDIFDRTFTITSVLRLLAVLVAFVGVFSAMMALQMERARELAVMRATGATPGQVLVQVGVQTGLMGLLAGLLALPVGMLMSQLLIHVINGRSFGWSMRTHVAPEVLAQALLLAVVAALLAGAYPAWKMAHTSPAAALREE